MSAAVEVPTRKSPLATAREVMRDYPLLPLTGLLLILVIAVEVFQPGTVQPSWAGVVVRAAIPLAILAGSQTLTMLTAGIDLSVGYVASMAGFVTATLVGPLGGVPLAILAALVVAAIAGLISGVGVAVFRVHPLIMTLGIGLVVYGFSNVWQLQMVQTGSGVPSELRTLGVELFSGVVPLSLVVFVPLAAVILIGLRRTGYGRLLFAIGDNPVAARLSGARSWQVLIVLYVISAC